MHVVATPHLETGIGGIDFKLVPQVFQIFLIVSWDIPIRIDSLTPPASSPIAKYPGLSRGISHFILEGLAETRKNTTTKLRRSTLGKVD